MLVNEEVGLDVASLRALRSVTDLPLRATKATAQAIERSLSSLAPPLAHDGGDIRSGQSSLPQRSGFVRQPVWASCGGLCGTLHRGSEVVSSDATLDECFLAELHQTSANARPPSSLKFMTSSQYRGMPPTLSSKQKWSSVSRRCMGNIERECTRLLS